MGPWGPWGSRDIGPRDGAKVGPGAMGIDGRGGGGKGHEEPGQRRAAESHRRGGRAGRVEAELCDHEARPLKSAERAMRPWASSSGSMAAIGVHGHAVV